MTDKKENDVTKDVRRLFPFAKRSAITMVGRQKMYHAKDRIAFVLVATDLSDNSMQELKKNMERTPLVQKFSSDELKIHFDEENVKMIAFKKSDLASSILAELQLYRIDSSTRVKKSLPEKQLSIRRNRANRGRRLRALRKNYE